MMTEQTPEIPEKPVQPEVVSEINPKKTPLKIVLLVILGLVIMAGAVYAGMQIGKKQVAGELLQKITPSPIPQPTEIPQTLDETTNWKTYTNNVYSYTINYPSNFKIGLCKDCNPPEIEVSLENEDKTISIGVEYAHQFTLCANSPYPCIPAKNLKINIMGKEYTHEEYYIDYYKRYIFKIEDIEQNRQFSQISISGAYNNVSDAKLIDQILSTFKFLD